jgi:dephospho-CoA kinase
MAAGKSTIAAALEDAGYHRMSFAGPLKNIAALAYGPVSKAEMYEVMPIAAGFDKHLVSGREILQDIGQYMKYVDRDFWMKCFLRDAERYDTMPLVVDDGRFLFERDLLRSNGWLIVGIDTEDEVRYDRYQTLYGRRPTEAEATHESERDVPQIVRESDIIVSGTTEAYQNVRAILERANERGTPRR